jgi:uncharacterized protein involved in cysteine biosynthesis
VNRIPDWVLWMALAISALALALMFAFVLLGVTDAR